MTIDQITDALVEVERRYPIERGAINWRLQDMYTGRRIFAGSEHECRRERCRLMAEAVMNIIGKQEDQ